MTLAIDILLWLLVGVLALFAVLRGRLLLNDGLHGLSWTRLDRRCWRGGGESDEQIMRGK